MHEQGEPSVLGSLPRTRPQRPSRRRTETKDASTDAKGAARKTSAKPRAANAATAKAATAKTSAPKTSTSKTSAPKASAPKASAARPGAAKTPPPRRREPPAPKQGYEPMEEPRTGTTVHPPSGVELVESVATIFAELANVGLKAGGRVLKDALSPIRRS